MSRLGLRLKPWAYTARGPQPAGDDRSSQAACPSPDRGLRVAGLNTSPPAISLVCAAALLAVSMLILPDAAGSEPATAASKGDRYFFARDARITAPVEGSVQVFGGSADIRDVVRGDVIVLGGNVVIEGDGLVEGNLIYGGGKVTGAEGRVTGRTFSLTTMDGAAAAITRSAVTAALLLVWLLAAVVAALVAGREIRFSSAEVRASAFHCFTLGLVAFTSFVITAIVFSYLVPFLIGIPLLAILAAFAILTKVYGLIAVFHAVGTLVAGSRTREELQSRKWLRGDLAMVVIGLLILGSIHLVPVIGTIVWSCASVFGIGAALSTKFGRREPAFLAWRPAEA